jgi:hypothetical protein
MTDRIANLAIQDICNSRRIQSLKNEPPSRIELEESPYSNGLLKFDLDMRRKSEILKYQNAALQTNSLTKKQKWSQLTNGNTEKVSSAYLKSLILCNDRLIYTNPSASNVPPDPNVPFLYNDETVPLYHFINPKNTRAYGIINSENNTDEL